MVSYRHFERKREIFFVSLGLTLSPHVPRHSPLSPSVFHTASALSAPSGHLPLEGKAAIRGYHLLKRRRRRPCESIRSPSTVIPSAAEGSLLHCRHRHTCALTQTTPWCFPLSPFSHSRFTGLPKGSLHFGPHDTQERRIVSYRFSYRCVELCLFEALYPAPLARAVWPHRKAP